MIYSCHYYSVGFFVFAKLHHSGTWEPVLEVDNELQGRDFIFWLENNPFITKQLLEVANDNTGAMHFYSLPATSPLH